ncbi:MAG: hypothetical protein ACOC31_01960, partial [Bacteroidota bacterium]
MILSKRYILSSVLVFGFVVAHSQNIKRAYKQLEKPDYEKADEFFKEILAEDNNHMAAHFGMALLYSNENFTKKDYLVSWEHADLVQNNISKISAEDQEIIAEYYTNTEERRSSRPVKKKMEISIEEMEDKLIRLVREGNDLQIVNQVIEQFPDFRYHQNAIHIRNYLEFRAAEKQNTVDAFHAFIHNYPDAAQVPLAIEKRNRLIFEEAKNKNSLEAIQEFINNYPQAKELSQALRIRNKLAFDQARQKNTVEAFENFINTFPEALEVMDAKLLQKDLIYQRAKRIKTLESFNEFIARYPEGGQYVDIFNLKSSELGKNLKQQNKYPGDHLLWVRVFDNNSRNDFCGAVEALDESIIIAGNTQEDTTNYFNGWILMLNNEGKMIWNKQVGDFKNDVVTQASINNTNEIILGGYTQSNYDTLDGKSWLFKIDDKGNKIWNRVIGSVETTGIALNDAGEIIVGGYLYQGDSIIAPHYFLTRLSMDGKRLWSRDYINKGKTVDVAVHRQNEILGGGNQWLFKTDNEGYLKWEVYRDSIDSISTICAGT